MEFQLHYLEEPKERTIAESNNALNEIPAANACCGKILSSVSPGTVFISMK